MIRPAEEEKARTFQDSQVKSYLKVILNISLARMTFKSREERSEKTLITLYLFTGTGS